VAKSVYGRKRGGVFGGEGRGTSDKRAKFSSQLAGNAT